MGSHTKHANSPPPTTRTSLIFKRNSAQNDYFANHAFSGSIILRFGDTSPSQEEQEFEDSVTHDLAVLGIQLLRTYTSNKFQQLYALCQQSISDENAYSDDTEPEIQKRDQKRDRYKLLPSIQRDRPPAESLAMFEEMRKGTSLGTRYCIRARIAQIVQCVTPLFIDSNLGG
ncbi:hypothetical protein J3458_008935 [Metarhizium acridum]|uniref:uncharacterized protein n=1 Tax=Metarhizium acridum TaxID=92637 RepID=UPI001C6B2235|nr:hypothetical protein J3458_008935 [Metarhizium acridum]